MVASLLVLGFRNDPNEREVFGGSGSCGLVLLRPIAVSWPVIAISALPVSSCGDRDFPKLDFLWLDFKVPTELRWA